MHPKLAFRMRNNKYFANKHYKLNDIKKVATAVPDRNNVNNDPLLGKKQVSVHEPK